MTPPPPEKMSGRGFIYRLQDLNCNIWGTFNSQFDSQWYHLNFYSINNVEDIDVFIGWRMFNSNNFFHCLCCKKKSTKHFYSKATIEINQFFKRKIIDFSFMMITKTFKDTVGKWTCLILYVAHVKLYEWTKITPPTVP